MLRTLVICMPLLLVSGTAAADGAVDSGAVPHERAAKTEPLGTAADVKKAPAAEKAEAQQADSKPAGDVKMSGMSILGNDDAPKSLVIVPWKSSRLGDMPGLSRLLDDSTQPVDKEVFMRELAYYQIKSESK